MNSAEGRNKGKFHVLFDDGQTITFHTPPGVLSGLIEESRCFRFTEEGFYYD